MKNLKKRLKNGDRLFGCWLNLGSCVSAEIVGLAGFDWVLIDLEHGSGSENEVFHQVQALNGTGAAVLVRVESFERQRFHRMLDFGAEGIMCPRINTPDEAGLAAKALTYQPAGVRGLAKMVRATQYGRGFDDYVTDLAGGIVGIIQIETAQSLDHLDDIAQIDGVDVLFTGPLDLSTALGIRGQWDHPRFIQAIEETARATKNAGKAAGILLPDINEYAKYDDLGFRFIACGSDIGFVDSGARNTINALRQLADR